MKSSIITVVASRSQARNVRSSINAKAPAIVKSPSQVCSGVWTLSALSFKDGKGTLSLR
ncbi:MAG: hypothetical protein [Caudoviricetes sp.]|nr:MAG: hypothetical protein [Caudoviricetes sp.]